MTAPEAVAAKAIAAEVVKQLLEAAGMPSAGPADGLFTLDEAAEALDMDRRPLNRLIKAHEIPVIRHGTYVRIRKFRLDHWKRMQERKGLSHAEAALL